MVGINDFGGHTDILATRPLVRVGDSHSRHGLTP